MSHFTPHTDAGIKVHHSLLAELQSLAPPGCDEDDLLQLADTVIEAILSPQMASSNGDSAPPAPGGSASTAHRLVLNDIMGVLLTGAQVGVLVDLCKQLSEEFVAKGNGTGISFEEAEQGAVFGGKRARGDPSGLLELQEDSDETTDSEDGSADDNDDKSISQKMMDVFNKTLALEAVDEDETATRGGRRVEGYGSADAGGISDLTGTGGSLAHTMKTVQANVNYISDYIDPLIPNVDPRSRADIASRIRGFLSAPREMGSTVEGQIMTLLQTLVFASNGAEDDDEEARLNRNDALTDTVTSLVNTRWAIVFGLQYAEARAIAKGKFEERWAALPEESRTAAAEQELKVVTEQIEVNRVTDLLKTHGQVDQSVRALYEATTGLELTQAGADSPLDKQAWGRKHRVPDLLNIDALMRGGEQHGRKATMIGGLAGLGPGQAHLRPKVPKGTIRSETDMYEQIQFPPCDTYNKTMKELDVVEAFPAWARNGFSVAGVKRLNPMQTHVHHSAFETDDNMLVCAPTGAGKTNVALMAILRVLDNYKSNAAGDGFKYDDFKIVYIAPMKALVQEVVQTFTQRLDPYGVSVAELSGDSGLSKEKLAKTQMIVATPEKWDIVTRKSIDLGVATFVRLIIIDEVHLLHNDRGPILESVVARTALMNERSNNPPVRLVGLSATVPNREDVAEFLKVDRTKGLHYFDSKFRPVPLQQTYCAVKQVPGKVPAAVLNTVTYDKLMEFRGQSTMIFVHSRKDTTFTANFLIDLARTKNRLDSWFIGAPPPGQPTIEEVIESHSNGLRDSLKDMLRFGFGVHHAGLTKEERNVVEKLFLEKQIRVLVCTSTLAWGVNLPAHAVIIKGTQIYNPEKGGKAPLSALDVLQMFGRAGRKGFDTSGSACIITTPEDVYYYLSILNNQIPIESQFTNHIIDALNAEVALGTITTVDEGARWLQHTYYYVRCKRDPLAYGVVEGAYGTVPGGTASPQQRKLLASLKKPGGSLNDSPFLLELLRENLIHSAAHILAKCKLIEYDSDNKILRPTPLGRIASTFFVHYKSIEVYNRHLTAHMSEIDIFHLFSQSSEFSKISVRKDEQAEVQKLIDTCPIPVKEPYNHSSGSNKISVLLQAFITGADLKGLALMTEMAYIHDSAQRILKALYEICVVKDFGATSRRVHEVYQMVLRRQWSVLCPIRQLQGGLMRAVNGGSVESQEPGVDNIANSGITLGKLRELDGVISNVEKSGTGFEWRRYRNPDQFEGEEKFAMDYFNEDTTKAAILIKFMKMVPWLDVGYTTHPITSTQIVITVDITVDVEFYADLHAAMGGELIIQLEDPSTAPVAHSSATSSGVKLVQVGSGSNVEQSLLRRNILYYESADAMSLMRGSSGDAEDRPRLTLSIVAPIPSHSSGGRAHGNVPSHYFLHVSLASWVGCSVTLPIDIQSIFFPAPPPPLAVPGDTGDDDKSISAVLARSGCEKGSSIAEDASSVFMYDQLSSMQAEVTPSLLENGNNGSKWHNVFVGMPAGTGKTYCAELIALRLASENKTAAEGTNNKMSMLYVTATAAQAERRFDEWCAKFEATLGYSVVQLTGHSVADSAAIESKKPLIIVCNAAKLQPLVGMGSPALRCIKYLVADHMHLLGKAGEGSAYETVLSRIAPPVAATKPYLLNNGAHPRVVLLSYPVRYPQAFASWMKIPTAPSIYSPTHGNSFNYNVVALRRLQVGVEGIDIPGSRNRLSYAQASTLKKLGSRPDKYGFDLSSIPPTDSETKNPRTIVFVQSAADATSLALQFANQYRDMEKARAVFDDVRTDDAEGAEDDGDSIKGMQRNIVDGVSDRALRLLLLSGVGYLHGSLAAVDEHTIMYVLESAAMPLILFAPFETSWKLPAALFDNVIVVGAEKPVSAATRQLENSTQPFKDCTLADLSQMVTRGDRESAVYCRSARVGRWSAFLTNAIAVESTLMDSYDFENAVNVAVAEGVGTIGGVLRVLQRHYSYHHSLVNPALYDIPVAQFTDEAIKLAVNGALSDQCDAVIDSLAAAGCVLFDAATGAVQSTPTGIAAAKHNISIDTLRQLQATAEDLVSLGGHVSIKSWLRMLCATSEATNVLGAISGVHPSHRAVLQVLARELPDELIDHLEVDFTTPEGKCWVLVSAVLSKCVVDPSSIVKRGLGAESTRAAALTDVTLAEMLTEGAEILNACRRVCAAAVEVLALINASLAFSMLLVNQVLTTGAMPGCNQAAGPSRTLELAAITNLLVSETDEEGPVFPQAIAQELVQLQNQSSLVEAFASIGGAIATTSELNTSISKSESLSTLRSLLRSRMAAQQGQQQDHEAADGRLLSIYRVARLLTNATTASTTPAHYRLAAEASVTMVMGKLHLAIKVEFDNVLAISTPLQDGGDVPTITMYVCCFDPATIATSPTFGITQVQVPVVVTTPCSRIAVELVVPVPEVDDEEDVNLQCCLVHGSLVDWEAVPNAPTSDAESSPEQITANMSFQQRLRALASSAVVAVDAGGSQPHTELLGGMITASTVARCDVTIIEDDESGDAGADE